MLVCTSYKLSLHNKQFDITFLLFRVVIAGHKVERTSSNRWEIHSLPVRLVPKDAIYILIFSSCFNLNELKIITFLRFQIDKNIFYSMKSKQPHIYPYSPPHYFTMLHIMYKDSGHGLLSTEYPKLFDRERITINLQKKKSPVKNFPKICTSTPFI